MNGVCPEHSPGRSDATSFSRNIAALAELPTGATTQRSGKSLSVEQTRQLLATASGTELEAMWTLMLYLGLRPGEAAGLSWKDIDPTAGTIHIWRARTTNTDGSVTIGATKTLGPAWSNPDNLVFTSPSGRPADPEAVRNEFDRIITTAAIPGRWIPNLLRHTATASNPPSAAPTC